MPMAFALWVLQSFVMHYLWLSCLIKTSTQSLCDGHRVQAASVLLVVDDNCRKQHYTAGSLANALCALCIILCLCQSDKGVQLVNTHIGSNAAGPS